MIYDSVNLGRLNKPHKTKSHSDHIESQIEDWPVFGLSNVHISCLQVLKRHDCYRNDAGTAKPE